VQLFVVQGVLGDQKAKNPLRTPKTGVAQLVEQRSPKPQAGSSSLSTRAKTSKNDAEG
jgi:hypothetical protein